MLNPSRERSWGMAVLAALIVGFMCYFQFVVNPRLDDVRQAGDELHHVIEQASDPKVVAAQLEAYNEIKANALILCAVNDPDRRRVCEQYGIPTDGGTTSTTSP